MDVTDRAMREVVRDWIKSFGDKEWTSGDLKKGAGVSSDERARHWIRFFRKQGLIEQTARPSGPSGRARYRCTRPGSEVSGAQDGRRGRVQGVRSQVDRAGPVAGTGRVRWPQHVERIKSRLKPGVSINKKGNAHIHFTYQGRFTWTSHSPRNSDEEYQQLVRRLTNEGMLK